MNNWKITGYANEKRACSEGSQHCYLVVQMEKKNVT